MRSDADTGGDFGGGAPAGLVGGRQGPAGAETLAPGAQVSEVARRNDVAPSLLFAWRREARVQAADPKPVFLPVQVTAEPVAVAPLVAKRRRKAAGSIRIELGSGRRLTVGADVDAAALARVLDVMERR